VSRISRNAALAGIPTRLGCACSEKADEVRYIAAAEEQPAAIDGVANEFSDPTHGLRFNFGGSWRECPCANVRIHRRGEKVAENPNRRRRRGDVSEETRMSIESRVGEQQLCRLF
jgi:hypothetical protein